MVSTYIGLHINTETLVTVIWFEKRVMILAIPLPENLYFSGSGIIKNKILYLLY